MAPASREPTSKGGHPFRRQSSDASQFGAAGNFGPTPSGPPKAAPRRTVPPSQMRDLDRDVSPVSSSSSRSNSPPTNRDAGVTQEPEQEQQSHRQKPVVQAGGDFEELKSSTCSADLNGRFSKSGLYSFS